MKIAMLYELFWPSHRGRSVVVLSCLLFLVMIVMHVAIAISRQAEQIRQLAQRKSPTSDRQP